LEIGFVRSSRDKLTAAVAALFNRFHACVHDFVGTMEIVRESFLCTAKVAGQAQGPRMTT
jgi:hypothetical protein